MSQRLLIDECLSPDLVDLAIGAGHVESTCLRDRGMDLSSQRELFEIALKELAELPDLVNQVLEVTEEASGEVVVTVYELPMAVDPRPEDI